MLSQQPLPGGHRVGIVSNAGGMGWLAASLAEGEGLSVPRLSPGLQESLRERRLAGRRRQPRRRRRRRDAGRCCRPPLRTLLESDEVDAVVVPLVPTTLADPRQLREAVAVGIGR